MNSTADICYFKHLFIKQFIPLEIYLIIAISGIGTGRYLILLLHSGVAGKMPDDIVSTARSDG